MITPKHVSFFATLRSSGRAALQWRLILLWLITLLIPTLIVTLPFAKVFASQLDYSVYAPELTHHVTANALSDVMGAVMMSSMVFQQAGLLAVIITLLLSPFLTGTVITAARAQELLTMGKLVHGGISEYGRLFRLWIVMLIPLGIAAGIGAAAMHWADLFGEKAILESEADLASHAALALLAVLLLIADACADLGRAQFVFSTSRRSAFKAGWQGLKMLCKHPLIVLGQFICITLIGLLITGLLLVLRLNLDHASTLAFIIDLILTQLTVIAVIWMRSARLFAMAAVGRV